MRDVTTPEQDADAKQYKGLIAIAARLLFLRPFRTTCDKLWQENLYRELSDVAVGIRNHTDELHTRLTALAAENSVLSNVLAAERLHAAAVTAENERLRKALEKILGNNPGGYSYLGSFVDFAKRTARAALNPKETKG